MPFSFPASPALNATSTQNGREYRYAGNNTWELVAASGGGTDARWDLFLPAAPTSVTAAAGNAQATVSWTAPTGVLAQTPITDYTVQFKTSAATEWTTFSRAASTATTSIVTGLTNGTAYVFRVSATNGVGAGNYSAASASATPTAEPLDTFFSSVSLLLHMEGTGSTFVDSSGTPKSITAVGNATQSTSQSKFGSKAAAFNGAGDSLTVPYGAALDMSTVDFAVECWWYPTSTANGQALFAFNGSGPYSQVRASAYSDNGNYFRFLTQLSGNGNWISTDGGGSWAVGQWYHIAAVRTGSQFKLYVNGASVISFSSGASLQNNSSGVAIGSLNGGGDSLSGFIDEFRVTTGSNRGYAGSFITVPVAAFPNA
jgi:hypothetical protein